MSDFMRKFPVKLQHTKDLAKSKLPTSPSLSAHAVGGTLYIIATPIGHLADMTYRAIDTLKAVALIACEDTRVSHKLLRHYGIDTPCISYHEHNRARQEEVILARLTQGENIALISDAGTPLISDPGHPLVQKARAQGIAISPIPGACAAIAALSVAGLGEGDFYMAGFLPAKGTSRTNMLSRLKLMPCSIVLYEAPHRIKRSLQDLYETLADRETLIARELTKLHETLYHGTLSQLIAQFDEQNVKGELVLVIAPDQASPHENIDNDAVIETMLRDALSRLPIAKAAAEIAAATGRAKRDLYALALQLKQDQ
jgi:16S rRNA (cytidine1402-2'-O)-methyltransferase